MKKSIPSDLSLNNKLVFIVSFSILLVIAFLIRAWNLTGVPGGLYWDEMDVGYQAYSILKTGKDYFGNVPFLTVHSFADFRAPMLIYLTIPFIYLFDLTALGVRMPVAVFGTISVLLTYMLVQELYKKRTISFIAAILITFAPWNIQYSRMSFEAIVMLVFFLGGLICFFKGLTKPKYFIFSAILFSLDLFTYNTSKLFIPLVLLSLLVIYFRKLTLSRNLIIAVTIFALSFLASLYGTIFLNGGQRFAEISVFTDPQIATQVDFLRYQSGTSYNGTEAGQSPRFLDKVVYNKFALQIDRITQNYLQVFSTDFLFINGDPNLRHSPSIVGELYRIEALTILLGLAFLLLNLKKDNKIPLFLISWILIAPLSAAVTREGGNHATRLFFLFPVLTIVSSLGIYYLTTLLPKKLIVLGITPIILVWVLNTTSFLNFYYGPYNLEAARAFHYGFDEVAQKALKNKDSYDYVIIDDKSDSGLMNYLFASKYDPSVFQSKVKDLRTQFIDFEADQLDNIIFMRSGTRNWENAFGKNLLDKSYLLLVSANQLNEETPENVAKKLTPTQKHLDTILYRTGNPAFYEISSRPDKL